MHAFVNQNPSAYLSPILHSIRKRMHNLRHRRQLLRSRSRSHSRHTLPLTHIPPIIPHARRARAPRPHRPRPQIPIIPKRLDRTQAETTTSRIIAARCTHSTPIADVPCQRRLPLRWRNVQRNKADGLHALRAHTSRRGFGVDVEGDAAAFAAEHGVAFVVGGLSIGEEARLVCCCC